MGVKYLDIVFCVVGGLALASHGEIEEKERKHRSLTLNTLNSQIFEPKKNLNDILK